MISIDRSYLSSVSFQLSIAATAGIVLFSNQKSTDQNLWTTLNTGEIQGLLAKKEHESTNILRLIYRELWSIASVTCKAQLLTVPLVLFHFDQFATLSILGNLGLLWMLPLVSIVGLGGTILLLSMSIFSFIPFQLTELIGIITKIPLVLFLEILYAFKFFSWTVITIDFFKEGALLSWYVLVALYWLSKQFQQRSKARCSHIYGVKL